MLRRFFKSTIRNLRKNPLSAFINIFGFAVGICCVILISLWVMQQLSFDRFNKNYDHLCRITMTGNLDNGIGEFPYIPTTFGPEFKEKFPEVIDQVRFFRHNESAFKFEDRSFYESKGFFSDNSVFTIFNFELKEGNPEEVLKRPYSVALSERLAKKYFGDQHALGKILKIDNGDYTVTAVYKNLPQNSHLQFDYLLSIPTILTYWRGFLDWDSNRVLSYLLLKPDTDLQNLVQRINETVSENTTVWDDLGYTTGLQRFSEIYLDHRIAKTDALKLGDGRYLYIFMFVGIAILIITCINYINLTKAQNLKRNKEVGLNKIIGAKRASISLQFVFETLCHVLAAIFIAGLLIAISLPLVNEKIDGQIVLGADQLKAILIVLLLIVLTCITAGLIPAISLTKLQPVNILQHKNSKGKIFGSKSGLVMFQFFVSIVLIILTLISIKQRNYLMNKNLGFDKEHVIYLPMDGNLISDFDAFKHDLLATPSIKHVTARVGKPSEWYDGGSYWTTGMTFEEGPNAERVRVGYDYFKTLNIKLIEGRLFSKDFSGDERDAVILNQKAVDKIGFKDPIGKKIFFNNQQRTVIGVVENALTKSLKNEVYPNLYLLKTRNWYSGSIILLKINGPVDRALKSIEQSWKSFSPDQPFKYEFLDEIYAQMYHGEQRLAVLFKTFAGIAIVLSCLGILGLAFYEIQCRRKEIGIRKVNGSTPVNVLALLSAGFLKWVIIAFILACPVAKLLMDKWLENFAYKTTVNWWIYLIAGIAAVSIAVITVGWQSLREARRNPVEALRYE